MLHPALPFSCLYRVRPDCGTVSSPLQSMVPDAFNKFYRFVFHLCKEQGRKHVQVWQGNVCYVSIRCRVHRFIHFAALLPYAMSLQTSACR